MSLRHSEDYLLKLAETQGVACERPTFFPPESVRNEFNAYLMRLGQLLAENPEIIISEKEYAEFVRQGLLYTKYEKRIDQVLQKSA